MQIKALGPPVNVAAKIAIEVVAIAAEEEAVEAVFTALFFK